MFKLIVFSVIAICVSMLLIGYTNDYRLSKCRDSGGKPIINNVGDVAGCIK